jgi:hypothetical protein
MFDLLEKHIRSEILLVPELWKQLQKTGVDGILELVNAETTSKEAA